MERIGDERSRHAADAHRLLWTEVDMFRGDVSRSRLRLGRRSGRRFPELARFMHSGGLDHARLGLTSSMSLPAMGRGRP